MSNNHIDVQVSITGLQPWRLTGFYGEPNRNHRKRTWELLRNLSRDSNLPWCVIGGCVIGDINNIASQTDKRGGALYPQWLLDGFNDTLEETGLNDLELIGHPFTWECGRDTASWIEIRLDRVLVTTSWLELYPYEKLYNLEGSPSDHSAVILEPICRDSGLRKKQFKFENAWLTELLCSIIIRNSWEADLFTVTHVEYGEVVNCVNRAISQDQNLELTREVTSEEVQLALFQMHPDKAPGPDGMTPEFFQKYWHIVGEDSYELTKHFFSTGELPHGLNNTNIILIPKKKNPMVVGDLRLIALCNILMKIITKVMENRMKGILDNVVSATQSAFIPNHLISDNIMLAYEVMHYLKGKKVGKEGYMALKLDMIKAYDRVEWEFLKVILLKMGFSPWRAPIINHMLFADDSYLFCKADSEEASTVLELLETYEKASGQQMTEANEHSTYLGLPNVIGRNKSAFLGHLKDKVNMKIRSWEGNYISRSGKEILVKHVAQTLPSYAMSVFLLLLEITRKIEKSMTRFWWNSSQSDKSKLSWMSWDRLSKHKHAGGMGFRPFRDFNIAMLGKQVWRLATNPNSLVSRVYKAKYFATSNILNANLGHNPSFIWRSLLEAKNLLSTGSGVYLAQLSDVSIRSTLLVKSVAKLSYQGVTCFRTWLSRVLNVVDKRKHAKIIMLCWSLWRSRNDLVWKQKTTTINKTVAAAMQYLAQWRVTQDRSFVTPPQPLIAGDGASTWVKPQPNTVKVSVDTAVFKDRNGIGFGLVARNCKGELIEGEAVFQAGVQSPIMAEAMAFKEALSWLDNRGWYDVTVESDCLGVVQAIRSRVIMRSYFGLIIEECHWMLQRLSNIKLFFVKRSANMVAHQLARDSYFLSGRVFDRSFVPISIQNYISSDLIK
ncbi:uncharacterized protein LOC141691114 [Apium graveolens]|uniref:uncharacterized protein LOC141691114 n=1 Tax=Apium graveolens TaxID=4045 RepID=UPI003D78E3E0